MSQCLLAILCSPTPVRIDAPKRNMGEDDHRCTRRNCAQVVFQPGDLLFAKLSHAFELQYVDESDKVNAFVVQAVPSLALRVFPITVQILLAVVDRSVVLAGHIEDLPGLSALYYLIEGIELTRL